MGKRRILVLVPDTNEHEPMPGIDAEVNEITHYHEAVVIRGNVTLDRISRVINEERDKIKCRRAFDVLWIIGGADEDSIILSDGERLRFEDVMRIILSTRLRLVVLSSCGMASLPNKLRAANIHILAGSGKMEDYRASAIGVTLAYNLFDNSSIHSAIDQLRPSGEYSYSSPNSSLQNLWYYLYAAIIASITFLGLYLINL